MASALGSGPRGRGFESRLPDQYCYISIKMRKRLHVYYSGMVQGVGFRFTAERVARSLGLSGWVKNLSDGRVEVVCEGEESGLADFLNKIKNGPMKHYINDSEVIWQEAREEFGEFSIKF